MAADITAAMNGEFSKSKRFRFAMMVVQIALAILSLYGVGHPRLLSGRNGVVLLLTATVAFYLKQRSQDHFLKGEEHRRMLFFSKSMEKPIPKFRELLIQSDFGNRGGSSTLNSSQYYDSQANAGYPRMAENLQESTFYTRKLANTTYKCFRTLTLLGLSGAIAYLLLLASSTETHGLSVNMSQVVDVASKLIAFFLIGQFAEYWYTFAYLQRTSDHIFEHASTLVEHTGEIGTEVLEHVSTYDSALASSGPIPTVVWWLHHKKLNADWAEFKKETGRAIGAQ